MRLREIREAYEELSGTFSKTARTLAISGIAIAWLFLPYFKGHKYVLVLIILAICVFVAMLLADILQNYILSKKWDGFYIQMRDVFHKDEDDEIKEDEKKNKIGWRLYDLKFWLLLVGYSILMVCFVWLLKISA